MVRLAHLCSLTPVGRMSLVAEYLSMGSPLPEMISSLNTPFPVFSGLLNCLSSGPSCDLSSPQPSQTPTSLLGGCSLCSFLWTPPALGESLHHFSRPGAAWHNFLMLASPTSLGALERRGLVDIGPDPEWPAR